MVTGDEELAKHFKEKNGMFKCTYYSNLEDGVERKNVGKSLCQTYITSSYFKILKHTVTCIKQSWLRKILCQFNFFLPISVSLFLSLGLCNIIYKIRWVLSAISNIPFKLQILQNDNIKWLCELLSFIFIEHLPLSLWEKNSHIYLDIH